jgi:hypothetical protein
MSVTTPTLKFFAAAELLPAALDVAAALDVELDPPAAAELELDELLLPHALANATVATNPTVSVPRRPIFHLTTDSSQRESAKVYQLDLLC